VFLASNAISWQAVERSVRVEVIRQIGGGAARIDIWSGL
jgi:hypothetical protein